MDGLYFGRLHCDVVAEVGTPPKRHRVTVEKHATPFQRPLYEDQTQLVCHRSATLWYLTQLREKRIHKGLLQSQKHFL